MSDPKYLQKELEKQFDHLIEECGELTSAYGKMRRWGAFSYNPELPSNQREFNIDWVIKEIKDVRAAVDKVEEHLRWVGTY